MLNEVPYIPIRRHRQIKATANPFDPKWESYFETRLGAAMLDSIKGRSKLIHLWLKQDRCCPMCHQPIAQTSGWSLYHLVRKVDGGSDGTSNLAMLHSDCHSIARFQGFLVAKPAPTRGF